MPRAYVKHGFTGMPEYVAWKHMKARCHNSNHPEFHNYGGRGIFVCQEWREDFEYRPTAGQCP
jgi:hypothetical protein